MQQEIKTITLSLPYKLGNVNCYLVATDSSYILIDAGSSNQRRELESALENAGCKPGNLKLILITHGDFDHIGNAAYLREKFGAKIAMHKNDAGMAERGDMFWNRNSSNALIKTLAPVSSGLANRTGLKLTYSLKMDTLSLNMDWMPQFLPSLSTRQAPSES